MGTRIDKSRFFATILFYLLLLAPCVVQCKKKKETKPKEPELSSELFEPSDLIKVKGPTMFPKPTHLFSDPNITVVAKPTFGKHREGHDAVMAYAEGYNLEYYRLFVESLLFTGFKGDVVLAISDAKMVKPGIVEYLKSYTDHVEETGSGLNLVVYMHELRCFDSDLKTMIGRKKNHQGDLDTFQMCTLDNVYGYRDDETNTTKPVRDVRDGRVVATLRYEWYWIWSMQYTAHSWLMLLDARDAFFQSQPFAHVPRTKKDTFSFVQDKGYLYFFGENHEATRLGISKKNQKWIQNGYGDKIMDALKDKPTICSGSTMGQQVAVETYLRAMVNEWDETDVRMTGSDQGFHNYLYYSSKLLNARTIKALIVWEQGKGIINNLGALRTKTLEEWGIYHPEDHGVYQWDNTTLSPVVHQWDRDNDLHKHVIRERMKKLKTWNGKLVKVPKKKKKKNKTTTTTTTTTTAKEEAAPKEEASPAEEVVSDAEEKTS